MWSVTVDVLPGKWRKSTQPPPPRRYYLAQGRHAVGRKCAGVNTQGDNGVSKTQGYLTVSGNYDVHNMLAHSTLSYSNEGKYSNKVDKVTVQPSETVDVMSGQQILMGTHTRVRVKRLKDQRLVFSSSRLTGKRELGALLASVAALGGTYQQSLSEQCTHLVVPSGQCSTTNTVLAALMAWLEAARKAVAESRPSEGPDFAELQLPAPDSFAPVLATSTVRQGLTLAHFQRDPRRRQLFRGLTFGFLDSHDRAGQNLVRLGGGKTVAVVDAAGGSSTDDKAGSASASAGELGGGAGAKKEHKPKTPEAAVRLLRKWAKQRVDYAMACNPTHKAEILEFLRSKRRGGKAGPLQRLVVIDVRSLVGAIVRCSLQPLRAGVHPPARSQMPAGAGGTAEAEAAGGGGAAGPSCSGWKTTNGSSDSEGEDGGGMDGDRREEEAENDDDGHDDDGMTVATATSRRTAGASVADAEVLDLDAALQEEPAASAATTTAGATADGRGDGPAESCKAVAGQWTSIGSSDGDASSSGEDTAAAAAARPKRGGAGARAVVAAAGGQRFFRKNRVPPPPRAFVHTTRDGAGGGGEEESEGQEEEEEEEESDGDGDKAFSGGGGRGRGRGRGRGGGQATAGATGASKRKAGGRRGGGGGGRDDGGDDGEDDDDADVALDFDEGDAASVDGRSGGSRRSKPPAAKRSRRPRQQQQTPQIGGALAAARRSQKWRARRQEQALNSDSDSDY